MAKYAAITIAVVFHNEEKVLPLLLKSIDEMLAQSSRKSYSFIFLDNSSQDSSFKILAEWCHRNSDLVTRQVKRSENHLAKARSQAMNLCQTDWLAFVDADVELEPDWGAQALFRIQNRDEKVAAVGGFEKLETQQPWQKLAEKLGSQFPIGKSMEELVEVDHVPTNNYLLNLSLARKVGEFNPNFAFVGEDLEFNVRLRAVGKIMYDPQLKVKHKLPETLQDWLFKMYRYGQAQSQVFLTHRGGIPLQKFIPMLAVLMFCLMLVLSPQTSLFLTGVLLLIPRTQFMFLSLAFYGMGEIQGFMKGICSQKNLENFANQTHKAK